MATRRNPVNLHPLTNKAAYSRRLVVRAPQRWRSGCPLGDVWRTWDFFNAPMREVPFKSPRFNRNLRCGSVIEQLQVSWERAPDDALYRPPTRKEGDGVAWRFKKGSPAHKHTEFEVDGHRVHLDCVSATKYGPGRSWTELVAFVDGECVAHGWAGGCSLGFGGGNNWPFVARIHSTAAIRVSERLRITICRPARRRAILT